MKLRKKKRKKGGKNFQISIRDKLLSIFFETRLATILSRINYELGAYKRFNFSFSHLKMKKILFFFFIFLYFKLSRLQAFFFGLLKPLPLRNPLYFFATVFRVALFHFLMCFRHLKLKKNTDIKVIEIKLRTVMY